MPATVTFSTGWGPGSVLPLAPLQRSVATTDGLDDGGVEITRAPPTTGDTGAAGTRLLASARKHTTVSDAVDIASSRMSIPPVFVERIGSVGGWHISADG